MNDVVPLPDPSPWYLENITTKERIDLNAGVTTFGRRPRSNICLIGEFISRDHCEISILPNEIKVKDLGTTNGTFVNGVARKNEEAVLKIGDRIGVGCETDEIGDFPIFLLFKKEPESVLVVTDDSRPQHEIQQTTDNEVVNLISDDDDEDSLDIQLRNFDSIKEKKTEVGKETEDDAAQQSNSAGIEKKFSCQVADNDISVKNPKIFNNDLDCHNNQIKPSKSVEKISVQQSSEFYEKQKPSTSKESEESSRRHNEICPELTNNGKTDLEEKIGSNNSSSGLKRKSTSGKKSNTSNSERRKSSPSKRIEEEGFTKKKKSMDKKNSKRDKEKESKQNKKRKSTSKISESSISDKEKSRISKKNKERESIGANITKDKLSTTSNVLEKLDPNSNKKDVDKLDSKKGQSHNSNNNLSNYVDSNGIEPPMKKAKSDECDVYKEPEISKLNRRSSDVKNSDIKQIKEVPIPVPVPECNSVIIKKWEFDDDDFGLADFDLNLSQSIVRNMKQEIVDLECEEYCEDNAKPSTLPEHFLYKDSKPESPIFIDDDEDDHENESVSKWAMKLSQTSSSTPNDTSIDNKNKRRIPEIINAQPLKRGKSQGTPIKRTSKESLAESLERRVRHIRQNDRISDHEKELKKKWLQKPSLQRQKERESQKKIQEERKQKLKELAKSQANRKINGENDNTDVRVFMKPKAKVTVQNRSDFLIEDISSNKRVKSNKGAASSHHRQTISEPVAANNFINTNNIIPILPEGESNNESTSMISTISKRRISLLPSDKPSHIRNGNNEATTSRRESLTEGTKSLHTITSNNACLLNAEIEKQANSIQRRRKSISNRERLSSSDREHTSEVNNVSDSIKTMKIRKLSATKSKDEEIKSVTNITGYEQSNQQQILNKGSCIKEINKVKPTKKKRVRFNDDVDIRYYELDIEESNRTRKVDAKDISIDMSSFVDRSARNCIVQKNTVNYTDSTLTEILSWNPNWLDTKTANVNGTGHVLLPMMHQFQTLEDFSRVIFPLMKLEVWSSIEGEYSQKISDAFQPTHINNMVEERRGYNQRFVLYADVRPPPAHQRYSAVNAGDLVITRFNIGSTTTQIFGYLSSARKSGQEPNKTYYQVNLELNVSPSIKKMIDAKSDISIKPITQIRVDLGVFNAIHHLKYSPLCKNILNPFENLINIDLNTTNVRYKGDDQLNEHQRDVLLKTYLRSVDRSSTHISLIEGPPGTGKSRVISNLTLQLLYGDQVKPLDRKILICAQSNAAIDVIALKLIEIRKRQTHSKFNLVRFGIFDKIHPAVQCASVQKFVTSHGNQSRSTDKNMLRNEKMMLEAKICALELDNCKNSVNIDELCELKRKHQIIESLYNQQIPVEQEMHLVPKIIRGAHIVCTTLSSCIKLLQHTNYFDVCIVDEATQCLEPWTLIPLQFGITSLILVGDTQQLPGTVLSQITGKYGFGISLFTRLKKCLEGSKKKPVHLLKTQYRMHPDISTWPNKYFYKNLLINDMSTHNTKIPLVPYIVFNLQSSQNYSDNRGKISNTLEADFVLDLITNLTKIVSVKNYRYGVITPYAQQRDAIRKKIYDIGIKEVSVNTVDSYQGKEKDIIIISNARTHGVGFLGNCQRLNVALTRARKCLILCGNFRSLESIPVWKSLLNNAKERKLYHNLDETCRTDFEKKVIRFIKTPDKR